MNIVGGRLFLSFSVEMKVLPVEIEGIAYLGQSSVGSPLVLKSNKRDVLQNIQIITSSTEFIAVKILQRLRVESFK